MKLDKSDKTVLYSLAGSALGFAVSKIANTDRAVSVTIGSAIGSIAGNHDQKQVRAAKSSVRRRRKK